MEKWWVCWILFTNTAAAQLAPWSVELAPHVGFVAAHREEMKHLQQGHSIGFQATVWRKCMHKPWHAVYQAPLSGVDLWWLATGNPNQLGQQAAVTFYNELPLNRSARFRNNAWQSYTPRGPLHSLALGIGVGYATAIWNLRENTQAAVLGSHFNAALVVQYRITLLQTPRLRWSAGMRITHFSNGAFQLPNLGTNNLSIFVATAWKQKERTPATLPPRPAPQKANVYSVFAGFGAREIPPPTGRKFATATLSLLAEHRFSMKSSIGVGLDGIYNSSIPFMMDYTTPRRSNALVAGAVLGYTLHFDRMDFKMQQGFYLRNAYNAAGLFYHRFGLRYHLPSGMFAQFTLNSQFAKAQFFEIGLGFRFISMPPAP
jgi:hypothetical protein